MKTRKRLLAGLMACALMPVTAFAVDGVTLIDQNRALAGNVTPGDTPGFPVTINRSGSFRLSGNLTVPADTHGIVMGASGVTLDLNGFAIVSGGGANGIGITDLSTPQSQITVHNGQVNQFATSIRLQSSTRVAVEDTILGTQPVGLSIITGSHSRILRNIDGNNGLIQAECPSIIADNITAGFISVFVNDATQQCVRYHNRSLNFGAAVTE